MKCIKRLFKTSLLLLIIGIVALGGWMGYLTYAAKTHLPQLDGILIHPSLKGEVRVLRDDWAVPHIEAQHETDAYFALGYAMGQDRLFQMELWRRLSRGQLAELLGPLAVKIDQVARAFRLGANADHFVAEILPKHPEVKAAAEAYIAGINYRMEKEPLPFEFSALCIPARPFTVADCLVVAAILPITFDEGLREDLLCSTLKEKYPDKDIDALFPGYSKESPVTIMESREEAEAYLKSQAKTASAAPAPAAGKSLDGAQVFLAELQKLTDHFGPALGSNSWVLAPSRSKSGKAILANDPHIGFTNPSIWYEAHLKYEDFESYGYHMPLIPFPMLGHNMDRGWGITMFENDDTDLFRETFQPGNPFKVMYKGEWADVQTITETIKVRCAPDQQYTIRVTPHGPVISDLFKLLQGYDGPDISIFWVWQQVDYTDFLALYKMGHARDVDSFGAAVSMITSPGLNISYADAKGNIAWWAAGLLPIRPDHVNPKQLLDGASGKDEVQGFVPFAQNPHLLNPERGYIVTANNLSTVKPVGPIQQLHGYWQPGDRAARIKEMLDQQATWNLDELKTMQFDDKSATAGTMVANIVAAIGDGPLTAYEQQALNVLKKWDQRHGTESCGASIFHVLCDLTLKDALEDELGPVLYHSYAALADHWNFFKWFLGADDSPYWDDISTPARETRHDILTKSFKETVAKLEKDLGSDMKTWHWGRIHTMEFKHPFGYAPLLGRLFNVGPFPSSGAAEVINNMLYTDGVCNFDVIAGPSTRRLIDFAAPEHSCTVIPTGNSGHVCSPSYGDQAPLFMTGQYREPRMTPDQIAAHKTHELIFRPL